MKSNNFGMDALAVIMLAFQGWRVYDYMHNNLQGVDSTTALLASIAFVFFTEIALLFWLHYARPRTTTSAQEIITNTMVWADFALSMVVGLGDVLIHNTLYKGVDFSAINPVLLLAPWLVVAVNIGAYLGYKMADSADRLAKAERELEHAEHQLEIEIRQEAIKQIRKEKTGVASTLAPHHARSITDKVTGRTLERFTGKQALPHPQDIPVNYNAETNVNGKANPNDYQNFG